MSTTTTATPPAFAGSTVRPDPAIEQLHRLRQLDYASPLQRLAARPAQMVLARLLKPLRKQNRISFRVPASMFWGETMTVLMPEGWAYVRFGRYEEDLTEFLLRAVTPGMRFVDIGAHFGYFTLLAARLVGPSGEVHAFEPTPRTFDILARNVGRRTNVTLNRQAVFSTSTTIRLVDMGPALAGYNSFVQPRLAAEEAQQGTVLEGIPTTSVDEYLRNRPIRPTFIKIDAESAEDAILSGMQTTLAEVRPTLAVEVGDFDLPDVPPSRAVIERIAAAGYDIYSVEAGRLVPHALQARYEPGTVVALPRNRGAIDGRPTSTRMV